MEIKMKRWSLSLSLVLTLGLGCSEDSGGKKDPDGSIADQAVGDKRVWPDTAPRACTKNKLKAFGGKYTAVISTLQIGAEKEGFDINNDDLDNNPNTGKVDNVLHLIGVLANTSIADSMKKGEISIPYEFFDIDDLKNDTCFNYALYVGRFPVDYDTDGEKAGGPVGKPGKDCNDNDKDIGSTKKEVAGNGVDDDCDKLADEDESSSPAKPSTDKTDADGDGQTIADGDCDDRKDKGKTIKKGGTEICGDGLDNDCNGAADDGCLPWTKGTQFPVESLGLNTAQDESIVTFKGATLTNGLLKSGPSIFSVKVEFDKNTFIDLNLTHVYIQATVKAVTDGLSMSNGLLGGVLSARVMGESPNLAADLGYGKKDDNLLDIMTGPLIANLGMPKDKDGNVIPDVDVDGDGIEKFLDKDLDGDTKNYRVDTCIDGDGTKVENTYDASKKVLTRCSAAKDSKGKYRFVDGWSISLKFDAEPTKIKGVVKTQATTK